MQGLGLFPGVRGVRHGGTGCTKVGNPRRRIYSRPTRLSWLSKQCLSVRLLLSNCSTEFFLVHILIVKYKNVLVPCLLVLFHGRFSVYVAVCLVLVGDFSVSTGFFVSGVCEGESYFFIYDWRRA